MSARKAAKPAREAAVYAVGDIVLGKVRGYAPWPGMVVDPENVPQMVTEDRPKSTKTTFYCVRFFPNNDYAWLVEKDISRLKPHEISAFLAEPTKKKGDLVEAYKIAQDPAAWVEETDRKAREAAEAQSDDEGGEGEEEDQLESDSASTSAKSKKRKRAEGGAAGVSARKSKKSAGGETATASAKTKKEKGNASAKGKNGAKKSKTMVESEDEHGPSASGAEDAGPSARKEGKEPPAKKMRRDHDADGEDDGANTGEAGSSPENQRVKDWRHKLQKTFLGKVPPKDEDMPDIDSLFTTVETTEVGIEGLQYSKIGKVMRHIAALAPAKVPRDAEFKFRERAKALVERWQGVLNAAKAPANGTPAAGSPGKDDADTTKPTKDNNAKDTATADADMDAHGEADAPGEVEGEGEAEVKGVEEGTARIDLNGTKPSADVDMGEA